MSRGRSVLLAGALTGLIPLVLGLLPGDPAARLERLIVGYGLAAIPFFVVWRGWRSLADDRRGFWLLMAGA